MHQINLVCCLKYFTVIFSFMYWILGSTIIIACIWILNDPFFTLMFKHSGQYLFNLIYLVIFAGCFILLSAWFACYGILKQSQSILGVFIFTLMIIVVAEVAAGIWFYRNRDKVVDLIRVSVTYSIQEEYGQSSSATVTFDSIQKTFKCCGADGPTDWIVSRYNNVGREDVLNIAFSSLNVFYNIPESCCSQDISEITCEIARKNKLDAVFHKGIHDAGCVKKMTQFVTENSMAVFATLLGTLAVEILALFLSFLSCCTVFKKVSNKDKQFQNYTKQIPSK